LEIVAEGRALPLKAAKQKTVLALLLLHRDEVVSVDRLQEALWPERPPATATTALQGYVSQLRRLLEGGEEGGASLLVTRSPGYSLTAASEQLDLARFEQLAESGRGALVAGEPARAATLLAEALALWRGPPLADFAYEPWAQSAIGRLEELRLSALEDRIEADLACGRHGELVGELESLIAEHPVRERLRGQLMLALYRGGRQAGALEAYQDARRTLVEELGIEPGPALQSLNHSILNQDEALAAPRRVAPLRSLKATNLPAQSTPLIGRERELAEILALVRRDDVRLLTLIGAGGSGKTRLAVQAAAELVDDFTDGVFWVSLAAVEDPQLVVPAIATTVGAKEELAGFIDEKELLLLLDNLEQIVACGTALAGLLRCCPNLKLLVTSRAALRVSSEQEYEVAPLPETHAVELFIQRAHRIKPAFEPDAHVLEICRRLDGLPLAVELAAARAKLLSPQQMLERLGSSLELLTSGARDLPARQQTLRATIEWSYELLDEHEQELFVRLAVFGGSFDVEAAEAVCGAELDLLEALVDKSLLRQAGDGRFITLATIREFAIERLGDRVDSLTVQDRHATYFVDLAEAADSELHGVAQRSSLGSLKRELPNVRTALSWALKHDPQLAGRLSGALAQFWFMHGGWSEGEAGAEAALSHGGLSEAVRMRVLFGSALLGVALQDERGVVRAKELLELAQNTRSRWGIGRALLLLGWNAAFDGEYARAGEAFRKCLAAAREADDDWLSSVATHNLADVAFNDGNYDEARRLLEQSVAIARALGDDYNVARSTADLGQAALRLGRREEAIHLFRESLRCGRELDVPDIIAVDLTGLAAAIADRDAVRAARLLGAADATVEELGAERQRTEQATREDAAAALLRHLPAERLDAELAAGGACSREEAIEAALSI
jgi:predicted ATPase/DNA-binding SARP family transcriptional activator